MTQRTTEANQGSSGSIRSERGDEVWSTRRLLKWMTDRFGDRGINSPRVVAELLLAHILECDRLKLYMDSDRPATPDERARLRAAVARASDHEPVQYIVGRSPFFGFELDVDPSTLIPQPATEDLVSAVLAWARANEPVSRIVDIGTGTGCIAIALARGLPDVQIIATDIVPEALALAERNAVQLGVADRIEFAQGDGLAALAEGAADFDVICGNPPYIPDNEWNGDLVEASVREHVPETATRGGVDGLDVIRPIIAGATARLRPGGLLALEVADAHRASVVALAEAAADLVDARVTKDSEGYWRVFTACRAPASA